MTRSRRLCALLTASLVLAGCNAENRALGHTMTIEAGWSEAEWVCLDYIVLHESGWEHLIVAPNGDYGIPQAHPGSKMASAGADWRTNPTTQIRWLLSYVKARYKTPCQAAAFKKARGWY